MGMSFQRSEVVEGSGDAFVDTGQTICGQCIWSTIRVFQEERPVAKKGAEPVSASLFGPMYKEEDTQRVLRRRMKVACRNPNIVGFDGVPEEIEGEEVIYCDAFKARPVEEEEEP